MLKKKLESFFTDSFDIPLDCILEIPNTQIIGNTQLNVDGCIGIKKYEQTEIIIRCKYHMIKITGSSLSMLIFSQGRVCIRGKIFSYCVEEIK